MTAPKAAAATELPGPDPIEDVSLPGLDTPDEKAPDQAPGKPARASRRPTTRAERAAAAEARRAAKGDKAPTRAKVTKADVTGSIESLHDMLGAGMQLTGLPQTGAAVAASGKEAGEVWADAVKRYPQLEKLFGVSTDSLIAVRLLMVYAPLVAMGISEKAGPTDPNAPNFSDVMGAFVPAQPQPDQAPGA